MWKFILLIFAVSSSMVKGEEEFDVALSMNDTFNCYANYLKRHGILEESFETTPNNDEEYLCEMVLVLTVDRLYDELLKEFSNHPNFNDSAECIVKNLRELKWSDLDLKEQVYAVTDLLTPLEKEEKLCDIRNLKNNISSNAVLTCLSEKEFGETFDSIINNGTLEDDDDLVGDYCARKYGIENKLIDTNEYTLELNPSNIITTYIDCDTVNKRHFEDAEYELCYHLAKDTDATPERIKCYMNKYHENHYFDKTLAIALLGELKLSDEQKERERKKFVSTMVNITRIISEC